MAYEDWPEPPIAADETAAILGELERARAIIAWKCGGLDADGIRATTATSTITLGGLLKHLAHVEDDHFAVLWLGTEVGPPWSAVDWNTDPDFDWRVTDEDTPESLMTMWQGAPWLAPKRSSTRHLRMADSTRSAGTQRTLASRRTCGASCST
jgi:hypothetical protein